MKKQQYKTRTQLQSQEIANYYVQQNTVNGNRKLANQEPGCHSTLWEEGQNQLTVAGRGETALFLFSASFPRTAAT